MRFIFYSEKSVSQCLSAIHARMQVKGTNARPGLDGWVDKSGTFSIGMTTPVIGRFSRRTYLQGKAERENGVTVITGNVPTGASRQGQAVVFVALALVALVLIGTGNVVFGLLLIPFAAYLYVPMQGDALNSELLIDEIRKTLKARPTPPKKSTSETKSVTRTSTNPALRPGASRPGAVTARKPTPSVGNRTLP